LSLSQQALAAACCCIFSCAGAAETLVITGAREPLSVERLAADVTVIDAQAIRDSNADSLADLLRRAAGVQLTRTGGPGQSTGILVRGASAGQTVVLVDGVRIGSATLGSVALESLALAQVERIEVLRGPGSSLYGADAVGGVVQIFTHRGDPGLRVNAAAALGGYGSSEVSAGASGARGMWDGALALSRETSGGVSTLRPHDLYGDYNPDRDGFARSSGQVHVGFTPTAGQRLGLMVLDTDVNSQYDSSDYLPPSYAQDSSGDFRSKVHTQVGALDWRGSFARGLNASARVSRAIDDSTSGAAAPIHYRTRRDEANVQLAWDSGVFGQLVGVLEHETDKGHADSYLADVERDTSAVALSWTGAAGPWSWQSDLRHDDSSDFGAVNTARLGGAFTLAPGLRLRALAGTTFRAPSFNDLYFPGYGVATLQPERGRSIEFGLNWRGRASEAALTVFRNRVRDLVTYEGDRHFCPADPAYELGCARNIGRARLEGATLSGRRTLGDWTLNAQIDFLGAHDELTAARLARRAAHQATLGVDWSHGPFSAGASVLNLGARPDAGVVLASETTLDLKADWRFAKTWTLTARLRNATDRDTQPARDYQGLGRQAWIGLRFDEDL